MAMKIRFFSDGYKTKRASHRLRGDLMARTLQEMGHDAVASRSLDAVDKDTVVVFLKFSRADQIQAAREQGALTLYDLCDNKFEEDPDYKPCCLAADAVTVNTEQMGESVKLNTGRDSFVIPDSFERPILKPRFDPGTDVKLLWFGSSASLKFFPMVPLWQGLEREIKNYHFTMVTAKAERILNKMKERQSRGVFTGVNFDRIEILDWSWDLQGQKLDECDIVFMPVATDNYRTDTKSANRVIDSLVSGRFVVTSPLASYLEFASHTWQQDPIEGVKWALANAESVLHKITLGQSHALTRYNPKVTASRLLEVIGAIKRSS